MSETSTETRPEVTPEQQPTPADAQGEKGRGFTPITSQEDFERVLGERLARERAKFCDYSDVKAKASKFDQIEEQNKTELQKLAERAERAEAERDAERLNLARQQAAAKAGLPAEMAARLTGTQPKSWPLTLLNWRSSSPRSRGPRSPRRHCLVVSLPRAGSGTRSAAGMALANE